MKLLTLALLLACLVSAQLTVVLSGRVTDALTGLPVERASVILMDGSPDGAPRWSLTDAGGNYTFEAAATGTRHLAVKGDGFVSEEFSIPVAADHAIHHFQLKPLGAISGRITGEDGNARLPGVVVSLLREDFADGVLHFMPPGYQEGRAPSTRSNSQGSFEFTGLEPGRYIVSATVPERPDMGLASLRGNTVEVPPPAEGYVQTLYPGTTNFAEAALVSVKPGEHLTTDFRMAKRPLFSISGELEIPGTTPGDGEGETWQGSIQVVQAGEHVARQGYSGFAHVPGKFLVQGLQPGQYMISSIAGRTNIVRNGNEGFVASMTLKFLAINYRFAITDHDLTDIRVTPELAPIQPLNVNGFFKMANSAAPLPPGLLVQYAFRQPGGQVDVVPVSETGVFWLNGTSGEYSVQPVAPAGYAVTAVHYGGGSYLNSLIPFNGGSIDPSLVIELTDQPGSIAGTVVDGQQKPVQARVVLTPYPIPADFDFRAIRTTNTDSAGTFSLTDIAPGKYKALALTGDDRRQDHDLTLLSPRLTLADAFEIIAGGKVALLLKP